MPYFTSTVHFDLHCGFSLVLSLKIKKIKNKYHFLNSPNIDSSGKKINK